MSEGSTPQETGRPSRPSIANLLACDVLPLFLEDACGSGRWRRTVPSAARLSTLPQGLEDMRLHLGDDEIPMSMAGCALTIDLGDLPQQVSYFVYYSGADVGGPPLFARTVESLFLAEMLPKALGCERVEALHYDGRDTKVPDSWGYLQDTRYEDGVLLLRRVSGDETVRDLLHHAAQIDKALVDLAHRIGGWGDWEPVAPRPDGSPG